MAVVINKGAVTFRSEPEVIGKDKWRDLVFERRNYVLWNFQADCRMIGVFIRDADLMWEELGYKSPQDLIANGYGLADDDLDLICAWLEKERPDYAIGIDDARQQAIGQHGGDRKSEKKDQDNNIMLKDDRQGTDRTYTLRRLKRDRPDLADKVIEGVMSANAAAIEAGFRKKTVTVVLSVEGFEKAIANHLPGYKLVKA